jgi:hypothetical protein
VVDGIEGERDDGEGVCLGITGEEEVLVMAREGGGSIEFWVLGLGRIGGFLRF